MYSFSNRHWATSKVAGPPWYTHGVFKLTYQFSLWKSLKNLRVSNRSNKWVIYKWVIDGKCHGLSIAMFNYQMSEMGDPKTIGFPNVILDGLLCPMFNHRFLCIIGCIPSVPLMSQLYPIVPTEIWMTLMVPPRTIRWTASVLKDKKKDKKEKKDHSTFGLAAFNS